MVVGSRKARAQARPTRTCPASGESKAALCAVLHARLTAYSILYAARTRQCMWVFHISAIGVVHAGGRTCDCPIPRYSRLRRPTEVPSGVAARPSCKVHAPCSRCSLHCAWRTPPRVVARAPPPCHPLVNGPLREDMSEAEVTFSVPRPLH